MKREIRIEDAIGLRLAHDLTRIVPGEFKGRAFAKGHIIRAEDIPLLLDIGKRHVYVIDLAAGELHEDEAAQRMAHALAGDGISLTAVHEGKVVLKAKHDGMLYVDAERIRPMNLLEGISITTRSSYLHVKAGTSVAGVRPIPLTIAETTIEEVRCLAEDVVSSETAALGQSVVDIIPYPAHQIFLVTTGSEVVTGRVVDKFGPVLQEKFTQLGFSIERQVYIGDDQEEISNAITAACDAGATLVCVTGGMSVDPDDRSPAAIRAISDRIVTYGTPMLPGSMLMLAYRGETAIVGLPGAVMYDSRTSFDILLPRILTHWPLTKRDIAELGVGGWLNV